MTWEEIQLIMERSLKDEAFIRKTLMEQIKEENRRREEAGIKVEHKPIQF